MPRNGTGCRLEFLRAGSHSERVDVPYPFWLKITASMTSSDSQSHIHVTRYKPWSRRLCAVIVVVALVYACDLITCEHREQSTNITQFSVERLDLGPSDKVAGVSPINVNNCCCCCCCCCCCRDLQTAPSQITGWCPHRC